MLWTSRSAEAPNRLKARMPARKVYFLKRNGRVTATSNVLTDGRRPARLRAPTKSWNSSTADHGKPGAQLEHRRDVPLGADADQAADQQAVRHVGRNQVVLVRTQERRAQIAVERIVVVQVRRAVRTHVRNRDVLPPAAQIARRRLELPIPRLARARQPDQAIRRLGIENVFVRAAAPQIAGLHNHAPPEALIPLDVADRSLPASSSPRPARGAAAAASRSSSRRPRNASPFASRTARRRRR